MSNRTPLLQDTLTGFKKYKSHLSPNSAEAYLSGLRRFLRYLEDECEALNADSPTPDLVHHLDVIIDFADFLATQPIGEGTYRLYLTALSQWIDYLFEANLLGNGVTATDFQRLRQRLTNKMDVSLKGTNLLPRSERSAPPPELVERLVALARQDSPDPDASEADRRRAELRRLRNVALLEALISTGARIGEALGLDFGDLRDDQTAIIRRGVGKGDKSRTLFFDDRAWRALQTYLGETKAGQSNAPVFRRHDRAAGDEVLRLSVHGGEHVFRTYRTRLVRELCEELVEMILPDAEERHILLADRLEEGEWPDALASALQQKPEIAEEGYGLKHRIDQARDITPHSLRHAFGTTMLEETGDLAAVQDLMGHADPSTTRRYSPLSRERLRQVHRKGMNR
jgi:site-specific recombinase XerD